MRILITGHRGFIGQNMMRFMGARYEVVGFEWGEELSLDGVDRVIHLGAISDTRCQDWMALMRQNVDFSVDLANRCADLGIPIQMASSASVYGPQNTTFRETDEPNPQNLYAKSKLMVEQICANLPVQMFRYFNVYGPHEDHKGDQASPQHKFLKQAKETGQIRVFEGSDRFCRDFVPVEQICRYHEAFFDVPQFGVWNLGTGKEKSFLDAAQEIAKSTGAEIIQVSMPQDLRASYQAFTRADMTKTMSNLKICLKLKG